MYLGHHTVLAYICRPYFLGSSLVGIRMGVTLVHKNARKIRREDHLWAIYIHIL